MNSPVTISSWADLQTTLGCMKAAGQDGFEGLLARLFEVETLQRYYVARSGDQPVGDSYAPLSGVVLQTKRYMVGSFSEKEIEGDIDTALREVPDLNLFVVATTRAQSQLKLRLDKKSRETALDILLFDLRDEVTELGALVVTHWNVVREFFPEMTASSDRWANRESDAELTKLKLTLARSELAGCATRKLLYEYASEAFRKKWVRNSDFPPLHNHVNLEESIQRPRYIELLTERWDDKSVPLTVLEGEEGTGKTWIAAAFADRMAIRDQEIVFWFDSLAWANILTISDLAMVALISVFPPEDKRVERLKRNMLTKWQKPILIVLDGANERDAWNAAEHLIENFRLHSDTLTSRIHLLFTSRPLDNRAGAGSNFWGAQATVSVRPFDSDEFETAFNRYFPDLEASDLTSRVRDLATIPRYFRLCIELRDRLFSLSHLTKEILLWADLERKILNRDPQWRAMYGDLCCTASSFLASLASNLGWPSASSAKVATTELRSRHKISVTILSGDW